MITLSLEDQPDNYARIDTRAHVLAALGRAEDALGEFERAMQFGRNEWVQEYQEALLKHGYEIGTADGVYGKRTRAALIDCLKTGCRLLD